MLFSIPYFIMSANPEFMSTGSDDDMPPIVALFAGFVFLGMGLVLLVVSLLGIFLKPRPWVWIYSLVLICLGMTSPCFLPICIPLLLFWMPG